MTEPAREAIEITSRGQWLWKCTACGRVFRTDRGRHRRFCSTACSTTYCMPLEQRVASHYAVDRTTGCWVWTASKRSDGYGQMRVGTKNVAAHRLSYQLAKGEIPAGAFLCHTCDNRECVNPDHLFLGDHRLNAQDAAAKGRLAMAEAAPGARLTNQQALEIRASKERGVDLARRYNISQSIVSQIRRGRIWKSLAK